MRAVLGSDFRHHGVNFARLDVRDEHIHRGRQVLQFGLQLRRAQVAADLGQREFVVAEGGFSGHLLALS